MCPDLAGSIRPAVATCSAVGANLGECLVRSGLAIEWPQCSKGQHDAVERDAERAGHRMLAGGYVEPWLYRACIPVSGCAADCSDYE
jgi:endonuclease YncB( thermonuclease family)